MPLTIPILTIMLCLHYTPGTPSLYITDNDNAGGKVLVVLVFSMWVGGPVGRWVGGPVSRWAGGPVGRWAGGPVGWWAGGSIGWWAGGPVGRSAGQQNLDLLSIRRGGKSTQACFTGSQIFMP